MGAGNPTMCCKPLGFKDVEGNLELDVLAHPLDLHDPDLEGIGYPCSLQSHEKELVQTIEKSPQTNAIKPELGVTSESTLERESAVVSSISNFNHSKKRPSASSVSTAASSPCNQMSSPSSGSTTASSLSQDMSDGTASNEAKPGVEHEGHSELIAATQQLLPGKRMSEWQLSWCTPQTLDAFLKSRSRSPSQAAEFLAKALTWREKYQDILSGTRIPRWSGDLRVLTRSKTGQPVTYMCAKTQPSSSSAIDKTEHTAVVLEAAVSAMPPGIRSLVAVADMHGFRVSNNLNPMPMIAMAEMLKHPYRDRLAHGIIVDAPSSFASIWKVFSRALSEKTRKKIQFLSKDAAADYLETLAGSEAADRIVSVMNSNRTNTDVPIKLPSEI